MCPCCTVVNFYLLIPLYALASYVVYATTSGVPTAVQGGVYAVEAGGYVDFYPTWVTA